MSFVRKLPTRTFSHSSKRLYPVVQETISLAFTIVPDFCNIEANCCFAIFAQHPIREGVYTVQFGDYGTCHARGDGGNCLVGLDNIPVARRRGTHYITVRIFDDTLKRIGDILFEYRDNEADVVRNISVQEPPSKKSSGESNPRNEPLQRTAKSSSNSRDGESSTHGTKTWLIGMPLLLYLCDEMAKRGNVHFFRALIKLGIMRNVLENSSEYYEDFAETASKYGSNELAAIISMSSSKPPCDREMATLTVEKLLDAVQTESSLENSEDASRLRDYMEAIKELQSETLQRESLESWKWERSSIIHRERFERFLEYGREHPQRIKEINDVRVCLSSEFLIGWGSGATRVYIGLCTDGYERAVKRLPKDDLCACLAEQEKKMLNEPKTIESNHVVKYRFLDDKCDEDWIYLIMDLCEESLKEFVERSSLADCLDIARDIVQQVLTGLADLHSDPNPILHRDLKPSNILRNVHDKWLLADFGISRILTQEVRTFRSMERGTKDWRAVESYSPNGRSDDVRYKKKSDIQVAGMVAFYIVTKGEHPFGEEPDRLRNLLDGKPVGLDNLKDPPAKDLITWMLSHDPKDRPSAEEALKHPYLLSPQHQFKMLCKMGNQPEIKAGDSNSSVVQNLNNDPTDWRTQMRPDVLKYLCTDFSNGKPKTFHYRSSWTECLRLIRNVNQHWHDRARPLPQPKAFYVVGDPQEYFLSLFPNLPVVVHEIVRSCDWKERPDLKEYFS